MDEKEKGGVSAPPDESKPEPDSTLNDPLLKWFALAKNVIQRQAWVRAYNREERRMRRGRP